MQEKMLPNIFLTLGILAKPRII
ncbi:unnamed protein product [Acanthoscelides obtectus]|uniref:Uncharacterized protein n=1 Tax=Acanthoscelides obtectus TaxID=200917 RepID=A0A9P0VPI1_ACAOB|nr:unnamed protein product [Acanthoscelides obtectus]CAK1622581.1 hypothetical protein AOBTE_LOCUS1571 [Acanthoscelides obtectus]